MRPLLSILLQTLRHAFVGVAVVSVLMLTLRVHLHAQTNTNDGHGHGHGVELSLGGMLDNEPGAPANPDAADPDGCGYCHCPTSSVMMADIPAIDIHDQVAGLARLAHPAVVPDSLSYPPDLPPVRLS